MEVADKLAAAFAGTPVDPQEIYALADVQYRPRDPNRQSAGLWRPREDTTRLALATARKPLSQSCLTDRSEEHPSEPQSRMRSSSSNYCLKKKTNTKNKLTNKREQSYT